MNAVLVHLGSGMGNMLMATPMMQMLSENGYKVDLCLQGETKDVEKLFMGWPHIRSVSSSQDQFLNEAYDVYIYGFEVKGQPIRFTNFQDAVILHPLWDWDHGFELHSEIELYTNLARLMFPGARVVTQTGCSTSSEVFPDITENTCVLVPGGGKQMIIRKWGGYGELANHLDDVAMIGLPSDLDLSNRIKFPGWVQTVFGSTLDYQGRAWHLARNFSDRQDQEFEIPGHVKNYIGKLTLDQTAALIKQAGIVVGNDCGVTHLAVALGKPVFAIVGPTSTRKVFPDFLENVTLINKNYDCQPCQEKPKLGVWRENKARHFCPFRIRCMEDITAEDVIRQIESTTGRTIRRHKIQGTQQHAH